MRSPAADRKAAWHGQDLIRSGLRGGVEQTGSDVRVPALSP